MEKFGGVKCAPELFQKRLLKFKKVRDTIAHELWEIIHSNVISLNNGKPNWVYTHEELKFLIADVLKCKNEIYKSK